MKLNRVGGFMPEKRDILLYKEEDRIAFIEFNRPEKKNALNWDCWRLLDEYVDKLSIDSDIRALVISGHQKDLFSAGVDVTPTDKFITDMFQALEVRDIERLKKGFAFIQNVLSKLAHLQIPTIAAINGLCYSGAVELAVACDLRVAKEGAVMCLQETRLGLIPDLGGTVRLAALIGPGRAKELIFTARKITSEEAKALGLVNHIFPGENFSHHVIEYVKQITANSPSAVSAVKQIINATAAMDEEEALKFERKKAAENVLTEQCLEGIAAFLEKRAPEFDK
jgi:enoyl-CoA hydratase/carnithine racemase